MAHNSLSMYLQSTTLSDYSTDFKVEVTVNTCTCTDVFTIITTKDQSGGIYNSYRRGGQGFMAVSKQTLSSRSPP